MMRREREKEAWCYTWHFQVTQSRCGVSEVFIGARKSAELTHQINNYASQ